jgi:hypothetical protein
MQDDEDLEGIGRDDFFRKVSSDQKNDSFGDSFDQASPDEVALEKHQAQAKFDIHNIHLNFGCSSASQNFLQN